MQNERNTSNSIEVSGLNKVFGKHPKKALDLVKEGKTRNEIMEETGQVVALRDIDFTVKEGEIFVLMGLSGSGKSTLLRCLNRLVETTTGSINVEGSDITQLSKQKLREMRRTTFGMVFQHFGLFSHRTVLENVAFGLEIRGMNKEERYGIARETLETVGLSGWEHKQSGELSGGMQQRVGLARALAVDPKILLMDEPFSALDPLIRTNLQNELLKLHSDMLARTKTESGGGKTIVFVTHDLNEAIKVGDRIAILNSEGQITQLDEPENILLSPADQYVRDFLGDIDRPAVIRAESIMQKPKESARAASHTVHRQSVIKSVLPYVLESEAPVAVLDDNGQVIGELTRELVSKVLRENLEEANT